MSDFFDIPNKESLSKEQIEQLQKQKREEKFLGKLRVVPGLTLFSFNYKTVEIKKAEMNKEVAIDFKTHEPKYTKKIVIEPHCIYRQALNRKNFIKKLVREGILVKTKTTIIDNGNKKNHRQVQPPRGAHRGDAHL